MAEYNSDKSYGKRPLWQWIVIYLIIGLIVYGVIYYLFFSGRSFSAPSVTSQDQNTQQNFSY